MSQSEILRLIFFPPFLSIPLLLLNAVNLTYSIKLCLGLWLSSRSSYTFTPLHLAQVHTSTYASYQFSQFRHSVVSSSFLPHGLQHTRLPCLSPTPRACFLYIHTYCRFFSHGLALTPLYMRLSDSSWITMSLVLSTLEQAAWSFHMKSSLI